MSTPTLLAAGVHGVSYVALLHVIWCTGGRSPGVQAGCTAIQQLPRIVFQLARWQDDYMCVITNGLRTSINASGVYPCVQWCPRPNLVVGERARFGMFLQLTAVVCNRVQ